MTLALSGTNGLLQSVDYPTLTTGFTYNWPSGYTTAVFNPGSTLASGTINFPTSSLVEGMVITFSSSQQITALSLSGGSASIVSAVTFLPAKTSVSYVYRATGTTWYPTATVPGTGSQLVSGTAVTLTTQTSVDFTSIPSWVKRVTVMFNQTRTSGTSYKIIQIGSGSIETTGYLSTGSYYNGGAAGGVANVTSGFLLNATSSSSEFTTGHLILTSLSGNIWVSSSTCTNPNVSLYGGASGVKTTSSTLDRIRFTTVNGTDLLNNGSINILYE